MTSSSALVYSGALGLALGFMLSTLACGPVPGGALSGSVQPLPTSWSTLLDDGHAFCEIESRPQDPHSIQLDCFEYQGALFVQSHRWALVPWWPVDSWAAIWIEEPAVRVRIGTALFELRAEQVIDSGLRDAVLQLRGYDPVPDGIALFRFAPRTSAAASGGNQ